MYIVLILLLVFLLFVCYLAFDREILCPPVAAVAMFLFSSIFGLLRYWDWNMEEYSGLSVVLLMIGFFFYISTSYIVLLLFNKKQRYNIEPIVRDRIELNSFFLISLLGVALIETNLFYRYVLLNAESSGFFESSLGLIINFVRHMGNEYSDFEKIPMPFYLSFMDNVSRSFSIMFIFIIIHNAIFQCLKKQEILMILFVLLYSVCHLLTGNRGVFLSIISEILYLSYFFWNMKAGWTLRVNKIIFNLGLKIALFFFPLFVIMAVMLGRYGDVTNLSSYDINPLDHLTIYISSAVRNFDLFVQEPLIDNTLFGKETFYSVNRFLYNRFGIGYFYSPNLEFRSINGNNIGNIYTVFRRYYADFGLEGLIFLPAFLGAFFSYLYNKAKYNAINGKISYHMLLFSSLSTAIFYFPIDDIFFHFEFSITRFFSYVFLGIVFYFILQTKDKTLLDKF